VWLLWTNPVEVLPLEGVLACLLDFPLLLASTEDDLEFGAAGLVLVAEDGLSINDVFKFGGASREKPGICEGSQGLDLTDGELPRDCAGFLATAGPGRAFDADEGLVGGADTPNAFDGVDDLSVGVADLWDVLGGAKEGLVVVGVEDLEVDLVGVEDLTGGIDDFADAKVALEVGVEGLEDLAVEGNVGLPEGVEDLEVAEVGAPDDEGLLPDVKEPIPGIDAWCLETILLLEAGSAWILATCHTGYNIRRKWQAFYQLNLPKKENILLAIESKMLAKNL